MLSSGTRTDPGASLYRDGPAFAVFRRDLRRLRDDRVVLEHLGHDKDLVLADAPDAVAGNKIIEGKGIEVLEGIAPVAESGYLEDQRDRHAVPVVADDEEVRS